jgi:ectoine hydroxylase-related dioxygenase (phytanoyl-CoA dioxygenase family)
MEAGLCVAAWQLTDVRPGDGGFACVPGSHKSNYRPPRSVVALEDDLGCVQQLAAGPGSLVIFNEALVHGTLPWEPSDRERRSVLFKYSPGYLSWGSPHAECPIADPTPAEVALYEPPRRTGRTALSAE